MPPGHQPRDIVGKSGAHDGRFAADDVQMHAIRRAAPGRGQFGGRLAQRQHAAQVGPPVVIQFLKQPPAAEELPADRRAAPS